MSNNLEIETYLSIVENGFVVGGFIGDSDSSSFEKLYTWDEIFETEFEYVCLPFNGPVVVDEHNDGVEDMLLLVDSLRKAADKLEDNIRSKQILIRDRLSAGSSIEDATISFSKYMRGEYS